jgi:cytochrome c-type biogenesis protein CcmI
VIVVLQVILIAAVGAFVLAPLIQLRGQRIEREAASANRRRSVDERKTRLYRQLVDLDFDRDSGKISSQDHGRMREETMTEVLQVLADEERFGLAPTAPSTPAGAPGAGGATAASDRVERMIEEMKKRRAASVEGS